MITNQRYVDGVESIYEEQPTYEVGHDGSDGKCDCIGMPRGALIREGEKPTNMRGTNQAARKTITNLRKFSSKSELELGEVVLKVRDKDDPSMPLPDRYRHGGADYDPVLGETNFTHIGTVTCLNPFTITHMTSPTAKKDKNVKGWTWAGRLPWVDYGASPGPEPEPEPPAMVAFVYAENGKPVKMRAQPSTNCKLYWEIKCDSQVAVIEMGSEWSRIMWNGIYGYMMTKFLRFDGAILWTVHIPHMTRDQAQGLVNTYPGSWMTNDE